MNDLSWLAPTLLAFGALITSIAGAWITVTNSKAARLDAAAAREASQHAAAQSVATAKQVDGALVKLEEAAFARGTLGEKNAQQGREAAVASAMAGRTPAPVPVALATARGDKAREVLAALAELLGVDKE